MDLIVYIVFLLILGYSTASKTQDQNWDCKAQRYSTANKTKDQNWDCIAQRYNTSNNRTDQEKVIKNNCININGFLDTTCEDFNECSTDCRKKCGIHNCTNTVGGYKCVCITGYATESNTTEFCPGEKENECKDIDECQTKTYKCGKNSHCKNTQGRYVCVCDEGYRTKKLLSRTDQLTDSTCEVKCKVNSGSKSQNVTELKCDENSSNGFQCTLDNLITSVMPLCSAVKSNQLKEIQKLLDKISRLIRKFPRGSRNERLKRAGRMLSQVEQIARTISLFHDGNITHQINDGDIGIWTIRNRGHHKRFNLGSNWTRLDVDSVTVGVTDSPLVGFLEYHSLSPLLEKARVLGSDLDPNKTVLISPVVSVFFDREDTDHLNEPISIRLQHSQINTTVYPNMTQCVFWSDNETAWSTAGCIKTHSTANETICNCTHLTSFAILVALNDDENLIASWPLTLITQIGLAISLLCLSLSIITFVFCRSIQGTRTTIHTFLCASLFLGHVIFLLGIKAHYNEVACSVVAGFLHLFYLSAFCWMFLEGLELYFMLVKVFNTHLKKRYLLMIGYGVPAAIVIISASVFPGGYGTSRHCWLSLKRNFIWSFMGPVCLILLVNCGIFVLTVWKLTEKMSQINPDLGKYKRIRSTTVAAVAQLCILGLSWIFGFLQFGSSSLFFAYAFSILNTLQGLQIFIFHCLMNKKVRADYARWICAIAHFKAPSYSEFNSTSQTQIRSKPPNKDSTL